MKLLLLHNCFSVGLRTYRIHPVTVIIIMNEPMLAYAVNDET